MARPRKQELPVESSWRMVEGEHDSFDTSIVPEDDDHDDIVLSSGPSQLSSGSQGANWSIGGSQDDSTIQDFISKAEDEQVILRSPFRPSVPVAATRHSPRDINRHRSPDPEFYMPTVAVESPRRASARSSRTIRPGDGAVLRQRQIASNGNPTKRGQKGWRHEVDEPPGIGERLSQSLPNALFEVLAWFFGVVGLAFRYAQKPLAIALAIYFCFGGLIIAQNMATKSIYASLSPLCRIPGASYLDLPFCSQMPGGSTSESGKKPVEFDGLMDVQERFEEVLEKSAQGVSLPMEMKRSEAAIRDVRTMVRYSNLQGKEELVLEFDGFIDTARTASNNLQKFNTHVGSAVDSVISINRWTSRYLDGLVAAEKQSHGWLTDFTSWAFAPFQPAVFSERNLLDKYVEHTALVSDKIADLIIEAQAVLRELSKAEDHLGIIYDFVTRTQKSVQSRKDEILWTIWTLVGANNRHLHNLNSQLSLLRRVDSQRTDAVKQVSELIVELEKIQAGLDDLRDRVAEPELARGKADMPLSVHIETIDRGVERLEEARSRIRAVENDRIRQVLSRGKDEERLIDST
ncbi:hypothetical protein UCRPA7_6167 [Phaeoacremonium minimum UCRPA7]|uniref:Uncharacterized protein n=1 Tax=Phaeoacremonium minimum (strain UCR-PA7) TaxID=1286976 RepID=R8BGL0_PHAM7|nr:hypothetical protein UCRPA7_6167 [Phaeoacremonium minimum UCRPA7]EON98357.1 hypothetical protein UCRPA7_6167 [Phaeoacremonium minimum UCRPA7]